MFERAGRSGGAAIFVLLWVVAVLKVVGGALPLLATGRRDRGLRMTRRLIRPLGWVEGCLLTAYGLVLTAVGLLVQAHVVRTTPSADHRALAWHAYLWDPWFLVWGLFVLAALYRSRPLEVDSRKS